MFLYKKRQKYEQKLATATMNLQTFKQVPDMKPFYHFLNTAAGGPTPVIAYWLIHCICIFLLLDIPITDLDSCNLNNGYPGIVEMGHTSILTLMGIDIAYAIQNSSIMQIFMFQIEFWLLIMSLFTTIALWGSFVFIARYSFSKQWLMMNTSTSTFIVLIWLNISIECVLPCLYYWLKYTPRSIVTDDVRSQFDLASKQPFAMEKIVEQSKSELETESVLLYVVVRNLRALRANPLENNFSKCMQLSELLYHRFIRSEWKTLRWYGLSDIVQDIGDPLQLLEKDALLENLENQICEKVILPLFARMLAQTEACK